MKIQVEIIHEEPEKYNGKVKTIRTTHTFEIPELGMIYSMQTPIDPKGKHMVEVRVTEVQDD